MTDKSRYLQHAHTPHKHWNNHTKRAEMTVKYALILHQKRDVLSILRIVQDIHRITIIETSRLSEYKRHSPL